MFVDDTEPLFSLDLNGICPECSQNLAKCSEVSDSYNLCCVVCRKRLGEAVAYLISEFKFEEALVLLAEQGVVKPAKHLVAIKVFLFVVGVMTGCIGAVLVLMQDFGPPN